MPIKDPNDLYDKGLGENDPPISTGIVFDHNLDAPYFGGQISNYDPSKYTGYLKEGLYENKGNPDLRRGEAQSMGDKLGNALAQTVVLTGTQLLEMAGSVGALLSNDDDYRNGFTTAADGANAWLNENFPLYRSTEGTFGFTDASWWLQNASSLTASVIGFGVGGAGFAKGLSALGRLAKAGSRVENVMAGASKLMGVAPDAHLLRSIVNTGEKTLTAGMLAYSEGAMSGRLVYDEVLKAQLNKGVSMEEAQRIAAESAATTVQLNTFVNTGMNLLGGMGAFFNHEKDAVLSTIKNNLKHEVGETTAEAAKRIKGVQAEQFSKELGLKLTWGDMGKKTLQHTREAVAEGVEELTNVWAQKAGEEEGKKGKTHGFVEQLGLLGDYFDYTMNAEGALNFVLGAVAGPIQNTLASYIPMHKVPTGTKTNEQGEVVDQQGNAVEDLKKAGKSFFRDGRLVNKVTKNKEVIKNRFNTTRDQVVEDLNWLVEQQDELQKAVATGDVVRAEEIRLDMFQAANIRSIRMGMGENLQQTYASIAALDNTRTDTKDLQEKVDAQKDLVAQKVAAGEDTAPDQQVLLQLQDALSKSKGQTTAMKLGFSSKVGDDSYVKKANEAIKDLKELDKMYSEVELKHGFARESDNPEERSVADIMFNMKAQQYFLEKDMKNTQEELAKLDEGSITSTSQAFEEAAIFEKARVDYLRKGKRLDRVVARYNELIELIKKAQEPGATLADQVEVENALKQYGVGPMDFENQEEYTKRVQSLIDTQRKKAEQTQQDFLQEVLETEDSRKWLEKQNEGKDEKDHKSIKDYMEFLNKQTQESALQEQLSDHLAKLETRKNVTDMALEELSKTPTLNKVLKNQKAYFKKLSELEAQMHTDIQTKVDKAYDNVQGIRKYNQRINKKLQDKYKKMIESALKRIEIVKAKIPTEALKTPTEAAMKYMGTLNNNLLSELERLQKELSNLVESVEEMTEYVKELEELYDAGITSRPYTPPPTPAPAAPPPTPAASVSLSPYHQMVKDFGINTSSTEFRDLLKGYATSKTFSLKMFVPLGLTDAQSAQLAVAFKEEWEKFGVLLQEVADVVEKAEEIVLTSIDTQVVEGVTYEEKDLAPDYEHNLEPVEPSSGEVYGTKQTNPSNKGASRSTLFFQQKDVAGNVDKKSTSQIDPGAHLAPLSPKELKPGTEVHFELDLDYDGQVLANTDATQRVGAPKQSYLTAQDMINDDGTIKEDDEEVIDNFPIKIVMADGTTPQWLHAVPWVTHEDKGMVGPERWYHTVDERFDFKNNVWIIPPGNVQREKDALRAYRKKIIQAYNKGIKDGKPKGWLRVPSKVLSKNSGSYVFAEGNGIRASVLTEVSNVGGKRSVKPVPLALFQNGEIKGLESLPEVLNSLGEDQLSDQKRLILTALVPMANGSRGVVPLRGNTLDMDGARTGKDGTAWQTFNRITELFLADKSTPGVQEELRRIEKETKIYAGTIEGYRRLIRQLYTHFSDDKDTSTGVKLKTVWNAATSKGEVHIEVYDGDSHRKTILSLDSEGKLTTESKAEVATLFKNRYRAISLTDTQAGIIGLNSNSPIVEPIYDPKSGWSFNKHDTYNEFITQYLVSPVTFVNWQDGGVDGAQGKEMFYGVNPIIAYDMAGIDGLNTVQVDTSTLMADIPAVQAAVEEVQKTEDDLAKAFGFEGEDSAPVYEKKAASVGTTEKEGISLDLLEKMLNFTPQSERNDKTTQEVYDQLRHSGISHIAPGYNPFKRCS